MKQIDLTRRATMRTLLIAGGSCLALSQINIWKQPKRALASTTDNAKSLAAAEEFELSSPEQDVFVAIKKNLTYSKTVKDEQIAEFAKGMVETSPPGTDFKKAFAGLQQEFQLMEYFIRYIHA
ncbi:hypothetical protein A1OO_07925 [Enterovibrio norvegicus FF-33]|uniref:Uncharacterized protein n=1 Tax=Enterovibrio norvegicus FF-454 TaxID=1185651 RepID=A0A1E5CAC9_9GAMM|nr:hypothetical protein [Enterovibrio norvegicus]OEE62142.1 hypothetical protein A1OK_01150 [Enterovibrio norvegicus FF-454]OEE65728.1 hypothetical protein A1OO_07925 [Enterovibrio norvegicus FF-33]OEE90106.1 hypothetical protein A1OQ_10895 [Enterovibrio norvegicus FF-162]